MRSFNALAALLALFMLWRHGRAASRLFAPRGDAPAAGRLAALVPLLTCLAAVAVLVLSVRGLLASHAQPGAAP